MKNLSEHKNREHSLCPIQIEIQIFKKAANDNGNFGDVKAILSKRQCIYFPKDEFQKCKEFYSRERQ